MWINSVYQKGFANVPQFKSLFKMGIAVEAVAQLKPLFF